MRRFLSVLLVLLFLVSLVPFAFAEDSELPSRRSYEGKSWDDVVAELMADFGAEEWQLGLGYYNTVTGEEHYLNADTYLVAASMYKVPLNMCFAEKIAAGEMDFDTELYGIPYRKLLESTIIESNNQSAEHLWLCLGGYNEYRRIIAPYMGEDAETVDPMFYVNNYFTPRQMMSCLKLLYAEQERFPGIIDTMKLAEPEDYFRRDEHRFEIAHKYGYVYNDSDGRYYINDCGIVYTDEPIILVMFTKSASDPYGLLSAYSTRMADYAQYNSNLVLQAAVTDIEEKTMEKISELRPPVTPAPLPAVDGEEMTDLTDFNSLNDLTSVVRSFPVEKLSVMALVLLAVVLAATLIFIVLLIRMSFRRKINFLWGLLAVVFAAAGFCACILGFSVGTLITVADGDPQQTVDSFFSSIVSGNYEAAYQCLDDYADLGLGAEPTDEVSRRLYDVLIKSYAYELVGECKEDGLTATQQVNFRYFDMTGISADLEHEANSYIETIVAERPRSELYDAQDHYLSSVTDEVYDHAIDTVLSHTEDYYKTVLLDVELQYTNGTWSLSTSRSMLNALAGGTAA